MDDLRVEMRPGACCGFGNCAALAPQVFVFDPERHKLKYIDQSQVAAQLEQVRQAVNECPAGTLVLVRAAADGQEPAAATATPRSGCAR